ncbi:hypothetical protein [Pseudomonas aeruginosa]|uniref:hypothetical protein n=1 Tax=Pseudomonas aeruginosa TaxID=287 RepID=UPI000F85BF6C|nr:hypothetical protein [Pseudomonas aeruginosa]RUK03248.1 hypothetical protein IPC270_06525 [Pseudomonas aeruginosa]
MNDYKSAFNAAAADLSAIIALLGFTKYPGVDPVLRAITDLILEKAENQVLREERDAANKRADTLEHRMMGMMTRHFAEAWRNRDTQKALDGYLSAGIAQLEQERDAAQARVAELEMLLRKLSANGLMQFSTADEEKAVRAALSGAQAQHSAGYAEARQCVNCRHIGINDSADYAACHDCNWTGPEPDEDKCPGCAGENCMAAACPECGGRYDLVAEANITAPAGQVPQAWLDVQAERRRQIEAEGWTPEHDDEHACDEIAAFACFYAMPPAARDWDASSTGYGDTLGEAIVPEGWEPKTGDRRRDLVKACALGLAEIERLDRVAASQGGPSDA